MIVVHVSVVELIGLAVLALFGIIVLIVWLHEKVQLRRKK